MNARHIHTSVNRLSTFFRLKLEQPPTPHHQMIETWPEKKQFISRMKISFCDSMWRCVAKNSERRKKRRREEKEKNKIFIILFFSFVPLPCVIFFLLFMLLSRSFLVVIVIAVIVVAGFIVFLLFIFHFDKWISRFSFLIGYH